MEGEVRLSLDNKYTLRILKDLGYPKKYVRELRKQPPQSRTEELKSIFSKNGVGWKEETETTNI